MGFISQMMTNLYKPPKQEKAPTALPKNLTPAKAAQMMKQANVTQGQFLKGQVLDLRANQIQVLLENGFVVSARTEGTLNLSIGEYARFFVAQTTEDQILLKLAKEEGQTENPMIDKALAAANIQKTERSISIVTELLNHQQPANEASIRRYLSLSTKYPELPVKDLILMELHHIPVTKENVEQFAAYQNRNAKLLTQAQDMLQNLTETIKQMPEGSAKQELLQQLRQMIGSQTASAGANTALTETSAQTQKQALMQGSEQISGANASGQTTFANASAESGTLKDFAALLPNADSNGKISGKTDSLQTNLQTAPNASTQSTQNTLDASQQNASSATESVLKTLEADSHEDTESLLKEFFNSFLLEPEDIADPEKVQKYYDELNEKLTKLEQLAQKAAEQTSDNNSAAAPKQMKQNLSFMEAVNNVFPYLQLPLKFKETPAHGELYVYERKKALKPSDSLSALLHLELEALGTTDIFVTLAGNHVTTRFSMTDKSSGDLIKTELPKLTTALAAKGYLLQSEVSVREPSDEPTPTLLEQFLEEHAPGGLNRYTFDIRA